MCTVLTLSRGWRDSWLQCKVDRDVCPTIRSIPLKKHSIVTIIRTFCCSPITWREVRNKGPFCSPNSFNSNYNNSSRVTQCWSWNSFLPHDNEFFMVVQVWTFCVQLGKKNLQNYQHTRQKQAQWPHLFIAVFQCPIYGSHLCQVWKNIWITDHFQGNYIKRQWYG